MAKIERPNAEKCYPSDVCWALVAWASELVIESCSVWVCETIAVDRYENALRCRLPTAGIVINIARRQRQLARGDRGRAAGLYSPGIEAMPTTTLVGYGK